MDANVGQNKPLPANGHIELVFDRLLLPASITRQTFVLENAGGTEGFTPTIAYDPVARVVTITPLSDTGEALKTTDSYKITIATPQGPTDANGLRAIDGATFDPPVPKSIFFTITAPLPTPPSAPRIDYCRDIDVIFASSCEQGICHYSPPAAAGLSLYSPTSVLSTAIGRVAQGANTGPRAVAAPPSRLFGEDMPIVDPGGDPSNSWMMYKVLLATPSPEPVAEADAGADADLEDATAAPEAGVADAGTQDGGPLDASVTDAGADASGPVMDAGVADAAPAPDAGVADAGAPPPTPLPVDVSHAHGLSWQGISAKERVALSNYVLGREMPFQPSSPALTLEEMERLSLWIAQGSAVPGSCPQ